ncbi:MAG TPA: dihydrolipoyl dehydrogenase [Anaeromyxobacteraceae bacterium]|nr:dihydrolipoyl dehydrogenase [Anaeromyxobacteraceae bacterium]
MTAGRTYDAVVIGAGPGGYVAAIRLAQLGKRTALVEREALGGTCLNWGCIPSKALLAAANLVDELMRAADRGLVGDLRIEVERLRAFKEGVVRKLVAGVGTLEKGNGVEVIRGVARLAGPTEVDVELEPGGERLHLSAPAIVVATGAKAIEVPGFAVDGVDVWGAREALALAEVPRRLAVIGGGIVGVELGTAYAKLGAQVTILEAQPAILGACDPEAVRLVQRAFRQRGVAVKVSARARGLERGPGGLALRVEGQGGLETLEVDKVLVAVGFRPSAEGLGLERLGVRFDERGFVAVDERLRSSVPSIHAIGDLAGPPLLAHKASREGERVAEAIAGSPVGRRPKVIPSAVFCDPELAQVGLLEEAARAAGVDVVTGKFAFGALGRAVAMGREEGFVRVIAERGSRRIVGASMAGPDASDLVAEAALAIELGARLEDVAETVHAHPTLAEAFMEACKVALGRAVHVLPRPVGTGRGGEGAGS